MVIRLRVRQVVAAAVAVVEEAAVEAAASATSLRRACRSKPALII